MNNDIKLPEKAPHFFVRVAFDFLPEIGYKEIVLLSQLVKESEIKSEKYKALIDSLIKLQWAKIAGLEAIAIESGISKQFEEGVLPFDPVGQAQHSKAIFDFISHGKASLDSIGLFLNSYLNLGRPEKKCDLRHHAFREGIANSDDIIGSHIKSLEVWLTENRPTSDSIVATRNRWIHQISPPIQAISPPVEIGYLPIPKQLDGYPNLDTPLTQKYYWTTTDFIDFHFKKLSLFFNAIINRCISIEKAKLTSSINIEDNPHRISFFPMRNTKDQQVKMKVKSWNPIYFFNANKMLEELPDKILRTLSKEEQDIFTKIAKHRTLYLPEPKEMFIFIKNNSSIGISSKDLETLKEVGLITNRSVNLKSDSTLICGNRGWRISWNNNIKEKTINVIIITKLGRELANTFEWLHDEEYTTDIIRLFNMEEIDVQLIAISNFNGSNLSYNYDLLGFYRHQV
ncbi:MAG: hypothetical protein CVV44_09090 [Spirochaetae bacterium HGW-Spirochaetae-1]|jgi:hypothetical protein|nr:MAG: hypothetical protein CVV44_09090 [Spirochaetae bacterium HGW-Spirochaetae-1]